MQDNPKPNKSLILVIIIFFFALLATILLVITGYIFYKLGEKNAACDNDVTTSSTTLPTSTWKSFEEETEFTYLTGLLPDFMSFKTEDLYITLSSDDGLITLYVAGECEGCTVVPEGADAAFFEKYTIEKNKLMINGDSCDRETYVVKATGENELYEVTCVGEEEVHIWGECKKDTKQVELCDEISKNLVVENL